jgi:hypothetical protein
MNAKEQREVKVLCTIIFRPSFVISDTIATKYIHKIRRDAGIESKSEHSTKSERSSLIFCRCEVSVEAMTCLLLRVLSVGVNDQKLASADCWRGGGRLRSRQLCPRFRHFWPMNRCEIPMSSAELLTWHAATAHSPLVFTNLSMGAAFGRISHAGTHFMHEKGEYVRNLIDSQSVFTHPSCFLWFIHPLCSAFGRVLLML